jgi:hypothetical protein
MNRPRPAFLLLQLAKMHQVEDGIGVFPVTVGNEPAAIAGPRDPPNRLIPAKVLGLSLLVVDDNATSRRIRKDLLNHWGMQPTVVEGASAALAALDAATLVGEPFGLLL